MTEEKKLSSSDIRKSLGLDAGMKVEIEVSDTSIKVMPKQTTTAAQLILIINAAMAAVEQELLRLDDESIH